MRSITTFLLGLGLGLGLTATAGVRRVFNPVRSADSAPQRFAPSGKAKITMLAPDAASAFVGLLEIEPGAGVPLHRDESEEFVYILEGGGQITVDGKTYETRPGQLVYMPANAEVSFQASAEERTRVLQIFAPTTSAEKYVQWQPQVDSVR